jgi:hypothetical protein
VAAPSLQAATRGYERDAPLRMVLRHQVDLQLMNRVNKGIVMVVGASRHDIGGPTGWLRPSADEEGPADVSSFVSATANQCLRGFRRRSEGPRTPVAAGRDDTGRTVSTHLERDAVVDELHVLDASRSAFLAGEVTLQ